MPDLDDLRTAVDATAARAEVPDFTSLRVRARARRRRRHGAMAVGLAGAVALALAGGLSLRTPQAGPQVGPATHADQHRPGPGAQHDPATRRQLQALSVRQVVASGRLYSYGSGGSGELMTVWQACVRDSSSCRYAWRLVARNGQRAVGEAWSGDASDGPAVTADGGAYLLTTWDRRGLLIAPTGAVTALHRGARESLPGLAGSVAVIRSGKAGVAAVDTRTGTTWPLPLPPGADAVSQATVAADGTLWTLPAFAGPGRVEVDWLDGGRWHTHHVTDPGRSRLAVPGLLVQWGLRATPSRIAVLSSYDGATSLPVGALAVTTDSGRSWRELGRRDLPFATVDSMAADGGGTLYVADPDGRVWRSLDGHWDRFTRVPGLRRAFGLQAAGEGVLAESAGGGQPHLVMITGSGTVRRLAAR